jgi:hypothetical protein
MVMFPLFVPWFLIGLVASSSHQQQNQQEDDSSAADRYLKPFSLDLHDFPQTGRGIRTLVDRSPGDILLQVPVDDTIAVSKLKDRLPITTSSDITEEQLLALGVLLLRNENHPYVSTMLPQEHFSVWTLPPDLWDHLCLPKCYRESFQATRRMVRDFCQTETADLADDGLWAFSMVRSRSIAVPELGGNNNKLPLALIPGLDLFNHAFEAGTSLQLKDDNWTLASSKSYRAGDQIYLSYGDDKDNWKLLLAYGFSIPNNNNPNALVFWTWEELLQAAGRVRPSMFPEHVRQSLLQHPQLQMYTAKTENRATFSYDAKAKEPRESLQNGLTMVSSLATQLGFPHDEEALPKDVLEQLLQNRLADLQNCRAKSMGATTIPSEWKPFLDSVQVALEEEEAYLVSATGSASTEK